MHLDTFNAESLETLRPTLLACCDAPAWARAVADGRPYADVEALERAADEAGRALAPADIDRALAAHPRIGDRAEGGSTQAGWSRGEQSTVSQDDQTKAALAQGNQAYEQRFGRVFLICATGLTADQILVSLQQRLTHDEATEAAVVADELRKIAVLRLRKVVAQ